MIPLIAAVFLASLLGSLHCAGMCGSFLAFAVGSASPGRGRAAHVRLQSAYHVGRLVTYTALGAFAGSIGAALDLGGSLAGVQRLAAVLAGALMVAFGVGVVLRQRGVRCRSLPVPRAMHSLLMRGHRLATRLSPVRRALLIGLLTTLLPCGWLYAFVITSAGTANPALGALTMAVFWVGTLPVMVSLGAGLQAATGPLRARLPGLTAAALVLTGLVTVLGRLAIPAYAAAPPAGTGAAAERISHLSHDDLPCCGGTPGAR